MLLENTKIKQVFIFVMCRAVTKGSASALPDSILSMFVWFHQGAWLIQVRVREWCIWRHQLCFSAASCLLRNDHISRIISRYRCLFLHPYPPSPIILLVVQTEASNETAVVTMIIQLLQLFSPPAIKSRLHDILFPLPQSQKACRPPTLPYVHAQRQGPQHGWK